MMRGYRSPTGEFLGKERDGDSGNKEDMMVRNWIPTQTRGQFVGDISKSVREIVPGIQS